jgi:hypothetical protein
MKYAELKSFSDR